MIGIDKGGIPGLGALAMALIIGMKYNDVTYSTPSLLAIFATILMVADIGALYAYRDDIQWKIINRMAIWIVLGMSLGFCLLGYLPEAQLRVMVGSALLLLSILSLYNRGKNKLEPIALPKYSIHHSSTSDSQHNFVSYNYYSYEGLTKMIELCGFVVASFLIGLLTVAANVAGPLLAVVLIKSQLSKREINGTRAFLFLLVNFFKVPIQIYLGNLHVNDLNIIIPLGFTAIIAALLSERYLIRLIDQNTFELLSWILVLVASVKMMLKR
jgi:hypothetical protein